MCVSQKRPISTTLVRPFLLVCQCPARLRYVGLAVASRAQSWSWRGLSRIIQRLPRVGTITCGLQVAESPAWGPLSLACSTAVCNLAHVIYPCLPSSGVAVPMSPILVQNCSSAVLPVLLCHRRCGQRSELSSPWSESRLGEPPARLSSGLESRQPPQFRSSDFRSFVFAILCRFSYHLHQSCVICLFVLSNFIRRVFPCGHLSVPDQESRIYLFSPVCTFEHFFSDWRKSFLKELAPTVHTSVR